MPAVVTPTSIAKLALCSCACFVEVGRSQPDTLYGQDYHKQAFLPLWNSQWNATSVGHHMVRPHTSGGPCPSASDDLHLASFGIGSNTPPLADPGNGGYNGETIATLHYDFGMTGRVPYYYISPSSKPVAHNGGIPQLINMTDHLSQWRAAINQQFPDSGFTGVVALDWEAWFPIWSVNEADPRLFVYLNKSRELARQTLPVGASAAEVEETAKRQWSAAVKALFLQTLSTAKAMRPNASWGWYDYPACKWGRGPDMCSGSSGNAMLAELDWLWRAVDFYAPSIYLCSPQTCPAWTASANAARISKVVGSVAALAARQTTKKEIYPFIWYEYYDTDTTAGKPTYLSHDDVLSSMLIPAKFGAAGVVIWGSWRDGQSLAECAALAHYVRDTFGPTARKVVGERQACAFANCSGNGRCAELATSSSPLSQCSCYVGWSGPACSAQQK
eukprot:SAG31_NODE_3979_length_3700_cov_8.705915_2_plen_445_part_00